MEALNHLTNSQIIGLWLQALLTFAILSFLIKDNPFYKLAEHIFVGVSAGYGVVVVWHEAVLPIMLYRIFPVLGGDPTARPNYVVLIPVILGLLIISRFFPRYAWLSRWPLAFVVGVTAGSAIPVVVEANILKQMAATIQPLIKSFETPNGPSGPGGIDLSAAALWQGFNNLLLLAGVICVLSYFYFSHEHKGWLGRSSRLGIWFLMIAFGAGFGNTVMARISLLIGRVQFLLYEWWPVAQHTLTHWLHK